MILQTKEFLVFIQIYKYQMLHSLTRRYQRKIKDKEISHDVQEEIIFKKQMMSLLYQKVHVLSIFLIIKDFLPPYLICLIFEIQNKVKLII